jgi:hypothetical protein
MSHAADVESGVRMRLDHQSPSWKVRLRRRSQRKLGIQALNLAFSIPMPSALVAMSSGEGKMPATSADVINGGGVFAE